MADLTNIFGGSFDPELFQENNPSEYKDPFREFENELKNAGLILQGPVRVEKLIRCKTTNDKPNKKSGWYIFHDGKYPAGAFGDWKSGLTASWSLRAESTLSFDEKKELAAIREKQRLAYEAEQQQLKAEAAKKANDIFVKSTPATETAYSQAKKITLNNEVMQLGDKIIVPIFKLVDGRHNLVNVQRIFPDGTKRFLFGGEITGCYGWAGNVKGPVDKIYVAEGFATAKTIHAITGKPVAIAFNCGNIKPVIEKIQETFKGEIIIAADNDHQTKNAKGELVNPGLTHAREASEQLQNVSFILPKLGTNLDVTDFNDVLVMEGEEEAKRQILGRVPIDRSLKLLSIEDLGEIKPTDWVVEGFLPSDSFNVLFGPSGHGKSFVALDWGLSVSTGEDWHGRKTKEGLVLYICGEGKNGILKRVKAWQQHNGLPFTPNFLITSKPVRFLEAEDVRPLNAIVDNLLMDGKKVSTIIIDTLNRNFGGGDENSTKDMTAFVDAVSDLRDRTKAAVLVVHHTGLADNNRARGNSALRAALDGEFKCETTGEDLVRVTTHKQKDDDPAEPIAFSKHSVTLETPHGFTNSLVLQVEKDPGEGAAIAADLVKNKYGKNEKLLMKLLREREATALENRPDIVEEGCITVERKHLIDDLLAAKVSQSSSYYALDSLLKKGVITSSNNKTVNFSEKIKRLQNAN